MRNVMLDLETMGTFKTAPIVAIAAVLFDPRTSEIGDTFYQLVNLDSCMKVGLMPDASTILWWMGQSDKARGQICNPSLERADLKDALVDFSMWIPSDALVWGCGSDFDNVILDNAYATLGLPTPWKFWNSRCYRTVREMKPSIEFVREGTHHNALDDAISQAKHLQKVLGGRK